MAIKRRSTKLGKQRIKANKIFTDRVEPRKAFWDTVHHYKENMDAGIENDVCLLTYYGIGGIGKSTLLHKLEDEIIEYSSEKQLKAGFPFLYYDFDWGVNKVVVLEKMRDELKRKYKFKFPMFNGALAIYKEKSESGQHRQESKGYFAESEVLGAAGDFLADGADLLNLVPGVGPAALSTLKLADTVLAKIADYKSDQKEELQELLKAKPQDIYEDLQFRFAEDLTENLADSPYPLVVFLDTYEQLVNELQNAGQPLNNDKWLRSLENGLVVYSPNTIWVIAGREILKWDQIDNDWEENLRDQQHIMGALSKADTMEFLADSHIDDPEVCAFIYEITDGTPVYLDLCVSNYFSLKDRGEDITVAGIGKNKLDLMERFLRYTDDVKEELLYVLACIGSWKAEEIEEIVSGIIKGVAGITIRSMNQYSFIEEMAPGYFKLHKVIKDVLDEKCDSVLRQKVNAFEHTYYGEKLSGLSIFDSEYSYYLERYIKNFLELELEDDVFIKALDDTVHDYIKAYEEYYQYDEAVNQFLPMMVYAESLAPCKKQVRLLYEASRLFFYASQKEEEKRITQLALASAEKVLDKEDPLYLKCLHGLAIVKNQTGKRDAAKKLFEEVLEKQRGVLGENHPDTQVTMMNLSMSYSDEGRVKDSFAMAKHTYDLRLNQFGLYHKYTLIAKRIYGLSLIKAGSKEEAMYILKETLDEMIEHLGASNPHVSKCFINLWPLLAEFGYYDVIVDIVNKMEPDLRNQLGLHHKATLTALKTRTTIYTKAKSYDLAIKGLHELVAVKEELCGVTDEGTVSYLETLADVYTKDKQYEIAIKHYKDCYDRLTTINDESTVKSRRIIKQLALLNEMIGAYHESLEWVDLWLKGPSDATYLRELGKWNGYQYGIKICENIGDSERAQTYSQCEFEERYKHLEKLSTDKMNRREYYAVTGETSYLLQHLEESSLRYVQTLCILAEVKLKGDKKSFALEPAKKAWMYYQQNDHEDIALEKRIKELLSDGDEEANASKYNRKEYSGVLRTLKSAENEYAADTLIKEEAYAEALVILKNYEVFFVDNMPHKEEFITMLSYRHERILKRIDKCYKLMDDEETFFEYYSQVVERLKENDHPFLDARMKNLKLRRKDYDRSQVSAAVKNTPQTLIENGWHHHKQGAYTEALACFSEAREKYERNWKAFNQRIEHPTYGVGISLYALKRFDEATVYFERILEYDKKFPSLNKTRVYLSRNYLNRISRQTTDSEILQGRGDEIVELYSTCHQLNKEKRFEESIIKIEQLLTLLETILDVGSKNYIECITLAANTYLFLGREEDALETLELLIQFIKDQPNQTEEMKKILDFNKSLRMNRMVSTIDKGVYDALLEEYKEVGQLFSNRNEVEMDNRVSEFAYKVAKILPIGHNIHRNAKYFSAIYNLLKNNYVTGFKLFDDVRRADVYYYGEKSESVKIVDDLIKGFKEKQDLQREEARLKRLNN